MYSKNRGTKNWVVLVLMLLGGMVLGGFIGELFYLLSQSVSWLGFLEYARYGQTFGLSQPLVLNLEIIMLSFSLSIKLTVCGLLGMAGAILIYRRL